MGHPETNKDNPNSYPATGTDFKLERYKYILKEIHFLNENVHKYLSLFQALATAVVAGAAAVFVTWRKSGIDARTTIITMHGLLALFTMLALFVILSVLAGVFSWLDYRREEVELLTETVRPGFRSAPKPGNFWRWYETYVVLFMLIIVAGAYFFVEGVIIPAIR
jgi:hypothetical protein